MMSKKSPQLRFEGFTDDWGERKFGDISYKVKEKNKTGEFTETLTNSAEYGIINQRDFFDKDISNAKNLTGYYVVKNDDFVYNPRISNFAPVGPIKRNKLGRTGVMSPLYYVFRTHDIDKNYFEKYFDTVYWHRFMELNGDSGARADRFAIKDSVFVEMPIPYPTMDEQQKIGSFFKQLDDTIALHQRKLDLLKEQKKGYLQKMFPKNSAKVPELRFSGFADDWEERKLGELLKSAYQGINTAGDKVIYSEKGVEILQSKHITSGYITFDDTRFLDKKRYSGYFPKYVPKKHDILFANIGTIGPSTVVETNKEFLIAWNILKMTPNENVNSKFIELFLQILNEKHYYEKITTGNATKFVNKDAILNIELCISSFKEQQKIGSFFQQLDNTIALHQRKLDLLKEQKKGFLQKMFV